MSQGSLAITMARVTKGPDTERPRHQGPAWHPNPRGAAGNGPGAGPALGTGLVFRAWFLIVRALQRWLL